jgi:hypothetical protein
MYVESIIKSLDINPEVKGKLLKDKKQIKNKFVLVEFK